MNLESKTYKQFVQVYTDCISLIVKVSDREDFELLNEDKEGNYNSRILHMSKTAPTVVDCNVFLNNEWEPFQEASLCNAWEILNEVHDEIYGYIKMLVSLSKSLTNVESNSTENKDQLMEKKEDNTVHVNKTSKKKSRKKRKNRKKNKKNINKSGGLQTIDSVKDVFKGTSGEGVMSNMIDSIVTELNTKKLDTSTESMTEAERKQMEMLSGMLNIDPKQIQGVFGVAKKISNKFGDELNSDSINSNELLGAAQNLLKKMM